MVCRFVLPCWMQDVYDTVCACKYTTVPKGNWYQDMVKWFWTGVVWLKVSIFDFDGWPGRWLYVLYCTAHTEIQEDLLYLLYLLSCTDISTVVHITIDFFHPDWFKILFPWALKVQSSSCQATVGEINHLWVYPLSSPLIQNHNPIHKIVHLTLGHLHLHLLILSLPTIWAHISRLNTSQALIRLFYSSVTTTTSSLSSSNMAAVAALPPSHFNPSLSSSRRLQNSVSDERRNLAQSSSTDAELQPTNFSAVSTLTHAQQPTASDLGTFDTVNMRSEHRSIKPSSSAARAQLLNPNTSSRPSQLPRGHLWKEALKAPIQFVAGQKITSGHDIPYEPINRPILPGQGKGVLVSAMGPALSQEDDAIHAESSPVESLPPSTPGSSKQVRVGSNSADQPHSLIGPVKPATGPGSRSAGAALYQAATRLDQSNIVTTWPKLQRMGPGFDNTGNTCFLNATLQALVYTPALAIGLLDRAEHRSDTCQFSESCR